MRASVILLFFMQIQFVSGQDKTLPYYEIPAYPENFSAGTVASRVIDGLGFRFYWATEGLREEDLAYKPSGESRTSEETIEHIYDMSLMIYNATRKVVNVPKEGPKPSFAEMRKGTLENLKAASDILRKCQDKDLNEFKVMFKRGDSITEFPFWNHLNGPIADCLWHVGQIVAFRRSSGNPFTDKVSVFSGTVRK